MHNLEFFILCLFGIQLISDILAQVSNQGSSQNQVNGGKMSTNTSNSGRNQHQGIWNRGNPKGNTSTNVFQNQSWPNGQMNNWNNSPPTSRNWNNNPGSHRNNPTMRNWNNNSPSGNWKNGPPNRNWNNMGPNRNWQNGPQNMNWNNGPPNQNRHNGPPNQNWNNGSPNQNNWNNGPPNQNNWNNGSPNQNNWNNGPPNQKNWNNGPQNQNNWNNGPPNYNWRNSPPNHNWNNGPPNQNWHNSPPTPNWNNGPPNQNWNTGPYSPYSGFGLPFIDPDLPDGLDTQWEHMQAMKAWEHMKQNPMTLGALDYIPSMKLPLPRQKPKLPLRNIPGQKLGWPMRPHSTGGIWKGTESSNNTTNITKAFERRKVGQFVPKESARPKLAEFQHKSSIGWSRVPITKMNNTQVMNSTQNQTHPVSSYQNPYNYGFSAFGYNPWIYRQYNRPDVPDHIENRNKGGERNENATRRISGLRESNVQQSQQGHAWQPPPRSSATRVYQGSWQRPQSRQTPGPWTPSSRRGSTNWYSGYNNGTHGRKWNPAGEKSQKKDGDVEKEKDIDKEETKSGPNLNVIKTVLNEVFRQRNNKDLSISSIMNALNKKKDYKIQYKYEGNVEPPKWTQKFEQRPEQKSDPKPTTSEVLSGDVSKTSVPRSPASFGFSSKYIPKQVFQFPFVSQSSKTNKHNGSFYQVTTQASVKSAQQPWYHIPQNIRQQVVNPASIISSKSNKSQAIPQLSDIDTTTKSPGIVLNVDTEIQIKKGNNISTINHEQEIIVPINTTTLAPYQNGVTLALKVPVLVPNTPSASPTPTVEKVPVPMDTSMSASEAFGIVVACLIGLTVITGPIICILWRIRVKHRERKRKLSAQRSFHRRGDAELMETMITSDFGDPQPSTSSGYTQSSSEYTRSNSGYTGGIGPATARLKSFLTRYDNAKNKDVKSTELQTLKSNQESTTVIIH